MTKYISHFPAPVLEDLVNGRWLPVIGAGMSLNAVTPAGKKMPLWGELANALSDDLQYSTSSAPLEAISAYEHEYGRPRLVERLSDLLLAKESEPGKVHREFCSIPFDIVCTTNFDFLLERQYAITPRFVHPVVNEDQLSVNLSFAGTLLLKLHGDLHHPTRLVVTEADYDGFLYNFPLLATFLSNQLITKTAIFVGYSLDDTDFRQILHVVAERLGRSRRKSYTLAVGATPSDIKRFERRGVQVINLPGTKEKYGEILANAFQELRDYLRDNVIAASKVTEERPLRELLLPRDSSNRLCFFAIPLESLPFYRERIFPQLEDMDVVPVTADDVISPGDNVSAKIDSLIDRSSMMVIEVGSPWTKAELLMAQARRREGNSRPGRRALNLILVVPPGDQLPSPGIDATVIYRQSLLGAGAEDFTSELLEEIGSFSQQRPVSGLNEPHRLFEIKEYRAAVISAMTLLETNFRNRLGKRLDVSEERRMSLSRLANIAADHNLINQASLPRIKKWIEVRNAAVHTRKIVSRAEAQEIVSGVNELVRLDF